MSIKLEDLLPYYIGQPCTYDDPYTRAFGLLGEVTEIIIQQIRNPQLTGAVRNVKPHLRQLSDMTEEEMIGLLQLHVPQDMEDKPTNEDYDLDMFYNDGGNLTDADIAVGADYSCICYHGQIAIRHNGNIDLYDEAGIEESRRIDQAKAFHYLLSRGFDLFGLCDAGLAVDLKTIQQ